MKVLVVGEDGQAHALVWKLINSPLTHEVICAPGNGGTSLLVPQLFIKPDRATRLAHWSFEEQVDLIIPTSNVPLQAGLVDEVISMRVGVCGPPHRSARLAASQCYAKEFLRQYGLPTPEGEAFTDLTTAEKYLATRPLPIVIRADRPTVGDGIYHDRYTALLALRELLLDRPLDGTPNGVIIEAFHEGISISFSAMTDGQTAVPLLPTRLYDYVEAGDQGSRAPGMGAHTSNSATAQRLTTYLHTQLIQPLVAALQKANLPYWGVLGIDCLLTRSGPLITALRCNLRDIEAQVVLPRLADDLVPLLQATIARRLDQLSPLQWRDEASVGIALIAQGYPNHFPVGGPVDGLTDVEPGVLIFHNETHNPIGQAYRRVRTRSIYERAQKLIMGIETPGANITTTGGRVLTVVALGATLQGARGRALLNAERITFAGRTFREDVGAVDFL